jgi:hypothetical protein
MPSDAKETTAVTALFDDSPGVERAYEVAVAHGYEIGDVNVVMSEETRRRLYADDRVEHSEIGRKSAEGGELGGPTGGRVGIAISIAAAVGAALVLPGLGVIVAGPIAAALAAAGAAGIAVGLIGAAAQWGLPENRLREYEAQIGKGRILIGVQTRNRSDARQIAREWQSIGGRQVHC